MTSAFLLDQQKKISDVRCALSQCRSIEEVIELSLEKVREELDVQVASIFLFSKDGVIRRVGINGVDKDEQPIGNSWFPDDKHEQDASFSGSSIPKTDSLSVYGDPKWSNDLLNDYQIDEKTKKNYLDKLGKLKSGISVPLNGRYWTFGTLDVLNKNNGKEFSAENVYWLMLIGKDVANFISDFRRRDELKIFEKITEKLIDIEVKGRELLLQEIYDLIVDEVTSELTPYKACFLRILSQNNELVVQAKSCIGDISFEQHLDKFRETGKGIVGEVYKTQKAYYISDIDAEISKCYNQKWIKNNGLKSYACIPLLEKRKVFGTISVFTQYKHQFSDNDKSFLQNIAFLSGSIIAKVHMINELRQVRQERNQARENFLNASFAIGYDSLLQSFLHQYKTELIGFKENIKIIHDTSGIKREKKIKEQISWIEKRIEEIKNELILDSNSIQIDINNVIEDIIRKLSFDLSDTKIEIKENYDQIIPLIEIDEAKIKNVIFNLLSNAEKAIKKANKKIGQISVDTSIITSSHIQYIQILIQDNGIGIANEFKDKIFAKGFTNSSKEEGGTGMGLFVAKKIINDYGGKIYCNSKLGKGTSFFVTIPLKRYQI